MLCQHLVPEYDGLPVRRHKSVPTDCKSVVRQHLKPNSKTMIMKKTIMTWLATASFAISGFAWSADQPNVIFILADDQGSVDVGCYGAKDMHTPHTDALAARGIRFNRFYSAAPVCSPSRAGALTGRCPVRAGVPGNCSSQKGGDRALPASEITLAEMFKAAQREPLRRWIRAPVKCCGEVPT